MGPGLCLSSPAPQNHHDLYVLQINIVIALPVIATTRFIGQFLSLLKCMKIIFWLPGCLLVSDILNENDSGVGEILSRIKLLILGHQKPQPLENLPGSAKHPAGHTCNFHFGRTGWQNGSSLPTTLLIALWWAEKSYLPHAISNDDIIAAVTSIPNIVI